MSSGIFRKLFFLTSHLTRVWSRLRVKSIIFVSLPFLLSFFLSILTAQEKSLLWGGIEEKMKAFDLQKNDSCGFFRRNNWEKRSKRGKGDETKERKTNETQWIVIKRGNKRRLWKKLFNVPDNDHERTQIL